MLIISRKTQESIRIELAAELDPDLTLREVLEDHPIVVTLVHVGQRRVRLAIDAPASLKVWRAEAPRAGGRDGGQEIDDRPDGPVARPVDVRVASR
ncbi:MAG TPA: carbon storage regulator [Gammaproteobacteria bacterium]|jgi:sRNA-binding carbon storage regulator CsrA|nr:carbon storage regulator [Gammaproteobacteria bacterium]